MKVKELLVLEGLTFGYADAPLFEDLDLDFLEGSIVLLRGKNGTGKTTLCDIVAGALKADVRRCLWRGEEVDQEDLRLVVAYASQEPEFFPALSGMENLNLLQLLAEEPSEYLEKAVTTSLDLGLTRKDLERKQAGNYSGGMRQKLWIAAQLAKSRDFVILDEPFTSLDDETITRMLADSISHAGGDAAARARAEAVVEAESLIDAVEAALELDGDLLDESSLAAIRAQISTLQSLLPEAEANPIRNATAALAAGTDDFAAKRMDRNIQRALTGQRVEDMA